MKPADLVGACDDGSAFAACLDEHQLRALAGYLLAVDDWTARVVAACVAR